MAKNLFGVGRDRLEQGGITYTPFSGPLKPGRPGTRTGRRATYLAGFLSANVDYREYRHLYPGGKMPGRVQRGNVWDIPEGPPAYMAGKRHAYRGGFLKPTGLVVGRRGATRSFRRTGANVGSFKGRKGRWVKGKGGRFVGSGG